MPDVWCQGVFTEEDDQLIREAQERAKLGGPPIRADILEAYYKSPAYAEAKEMVETLIREYRKNAGMPEDAMEAEQKDSEKIRRPILQPSPEDEGIIQVVFRDAEWNGSLKRLPQQVSAEEITDLLRRERLVNNRSAKELSDLLTDSEYITKTLSKKHSLEKGIADLETKMTGFGNAPITLKNLQDMMRRVAIRSSWFGGILHISYHDFAHGKNSDIKGQTTPFKGAYGEIHLYLDEPKSFQHSFFHELGEVVYLRHVQSVNKSAMQGWEGLQRINAHRLSPYAGHMFDKKNEWQRNLHTNEYFSEAFALYCECLNKAALGESGDLEKFQQTFSGEVRLLKELWKSAQ